MRNRAKCKLCNSIIESFHSTDFVQCSCEEIALDGGESMRCLAKDWGNFIRIDDQDKEIIPKILNEPIPILTPTKQDKLMMLKEMIDAYEGLPSSARHSPVTHSDLLSVLYLLHSILSDDLTKPS